jgi:hypothetical protein
MHRFARVILSEQRRFATVSKERVAAQAMIKFMTSPSAAPLLRRVHEEPVGK